MTAQAVHANCLIIGTCGLLIRGEAGCGKSSLSETLIEAARAKGHRGVLVADDRVYLSCEEERVIARVPKTIAGKLEIRGFDLVDVDFQPVARVHLLIDLVPMTEIERLPEETLATKSVAGGLVPAVTCPANRSDIGLRLTRWAIRSLFPRGPDYI
ncbi:HPr kinase/phosphorylase [Roseibium sp. SCP14]|uniref:HPr kinase/phosphorylase n=1 Tax=Roseibium sp. SCP14 TaxID=3141375 RepID=UPI00333BA08A